jgi:hypothetical protein
MKPAGHRRFAVTRHFESTVYSAFPPVPRSFEFEQLSRLQLRSEGSLKGTPIGSGSLPLDNPRCRTVRISGSLDGPITIATQSGSIEIAKTAAALRKLVLNNGRLTGFPADADELSTDVALAVRRPVRSTVP